MIVKLLQIILACAIFNPFCCCTAAGLSANEVENAPATEPMTHSCCQNETASSDTTPTVPTKSKQPHDPDACPHRVLKESQVTSLKDGASIHYAPEQVPLILTLIQIITFEPVAQISPNTQVAKLAQAPPLALTQRYSVFRI